MKVAIWTPMRARMFFSAQRAKAALPPARFTRPTMMPSSTKNRKMPALPEIAAIYAVSSLMTAFSAPTGEKFATKRAPTQHADEQRGIGLLGDEGQDDGQDRGHQGPEVPYMFLSPPKIKGHGGAPHMTSKCPRGPILAI
jgi:hypothetical protein